MLRDLTKMVINELLVKLFLTERLTQLVVRVVDLPLVLVVSFQKQVSSYWKFCMLYSQTLTGTNID